MTAHTTPATTATTATKTIDFEAKRIYEAEISNENYILISFKSMDENSFIYVDLSFAEESGQNGVQSKIISNRLAFQTAAEIRIPKNEDEKQTNPKRINSNEIPNHGVQSVNNAVNVRHFHFDLNVCACRCVCVPSTRLLNEHIHTHIYLLTLYGRITAG